MAYALGMLFSNEFDWVIMDSIILLIWVILFISISFALIGSTYYEYNRQDKKPELLARVVFAFFLYFVVTLITGLPLFIVLFLNAFASTHRPENFDKADLGTLNWLQITFWLAVCLIYALIGWFLVSFICGRLTKPWKVFSLSSRKTPSILTGD